MPPQHAEEEISLASKQYSDVTEVIARGPDHDGITERFKQWIRVECARWLSRSSPRAFARSAVAPSTIAPAAGRCCHRFRLNRRSARRYSSPAIFSAQYKRELLIASADSTVVHMNRDFSAREQADALVLLAAVRGGASSR